MFVWLQFFTLSIWLQGSAVSLKDELDLLSQRSERGEKTASGEEEEKSSTTSKDSLGVRGDSPSKAGDSPRKAGDSPVHAVDSREEEPDSRSAITAGISEEKEEFLSDDDTTNTTNSSAAATADVSKREGDSAPGDEASELDKVISSAAAAVESFATDIDLEELNNRK